MSSEPFYFEEDILAPVEKPFRREGEFDQARNHYLVKYEICRKQNPKFIVEIGVRSGYSALVFLQACPTARYVGIDWGQMDDGEAHLAWARKLLEPYNATILVKDSQKIDVLELKNEPVDLFHVDGAHTTPGVYHDMDLAFPVLASNGLMICDDFQMRDVHLGIRAWIWKMDAYINYEYICSKTGELLIRKAGNHERTYQTK